jgi:hypothetical protein
MPDLSNSDYFREFLGSCWNHVYSGHKLAGGVAAFSSHAVLQQYQDMIDAVNRLSISTVTPTVTELTKPVIFRQSNFSTGPDKLVMGGGQVFGRQPEGTDFRAGDTFEFGGLERKSGRYYVGVDDSVVSIGPVIVNSLKEPSLVWIEGVDFILSDGVVAFKTNPFEDPRIPQRKVASDTSDEGESEIVLWMTGVQSNSGEFQQHFGFAAPKLNPGSSEYFEAVRVCMRVIADGPSLSAIDHLIASLLGLPCVRESREEVLSISSHNGLPLVVTDLGLYLVKEGFSVRPEVVPGAVLECGHPLSDGSEVFDRTSQRKWWIDLDGLLLGEAFFDPRIKSTLGFINSAYPVVLGEIEDCDGEIGRSASFHLAGGAADVERFWEIAKENGTRLKSPFGNKIYTQAGAVGDDGKPDFELTVMINPLQFLAEQLIRDSVVVVQIKNASRLPMENLFQCAPLIKKLMPAWLGMIILVNVTVDDEVTFTSATDLDDATVTVDPVSTRTLLNVDLDNFPEELRSRWVEVDSEGNSLTLVPEACSVDRSPDLAKETISFGDPSANVDSYGGSTLVCEEFIESTLTRTCMP